MAMLTRLRTRTAGDLTRTRIGEVVVVHTADGVTDEASALAETLTADPEHELVIADLPADSPQDVWKSFVAALPRGRRPLRVVPGRLPREIAPYVWQWVADRAGRPVLAPYGTVHSAAGGLFVHSLDQTGWVSFRRGAAPAWRGKRFPRPDWDSLEFGQVRVAGFRGVAEPLPGGMWLRPDVGQGALTTARARLTAALPCLPDAPLVVLGTRDALPIELSDVVAFVRSLPPALVAAARFVQYGEVATQRGGPLGQDLADALGTEVFAYTGIPTGSPAALDVLALRKDGSLGPSVFAQAYVYRPAGAGTGRLCAHRPPVPGLGEVSPGSYWYAQGIVVEVVRAGLWVRPAEQVTDPAGVRATPLDAQHNLVLYEETDRVREAAADLLNRLDETTRHATVLMPVTALSGNILPGKAVADATRTETVRPAAPQQPAPPAQPAPPRPDAPQTETARLETVQPEAAQPGQATADQAHDTADTNDTELHWLSRMMETMAMPVPARPSEVESQDDRVRGSR
jgi:hypothetical protein